MTQKNTFVLRDEESSVYGKISSLLIERGWTRMKADSPKFNLVLAERGFNWGKIGQDPLKHHLINYYRGYTELCRKACLVRTLRTYCAVNTLDVQAIMPLSFVIRPKDSSEESVIERKLFLDAAPMMSQEGETAWIAKASAGAKGEAIKLSSNIAEILEFIDASTQTHIVQKYIEKPLLLPGNRKFDIRCWVLVDRNYDVFFFNEGVIRTSADEYDPSTLDNLTCHITNHCIQEHHSANYGKYEEGNEMFFEDFDQFLKSIGVSLRGDILPQIHWIVKLAFDAAKEKMQISYATHHYESFQLFGFDFLIDAAAKVWLLEINGSPACAQRLLDKLASGIVALAIDTVFPPASAPEGFESAQSLFTKL